MPSNPTIAIRRQRLRTWFRHALTPLWRSKERWAVLAAVLGLVIAWGIAVMGFPVGALSVVTHYTIPFGIDGLGSWWVVWLLPAIATLLTVFHHLALAPFVRPRTPRMLPVLHATTILLNFGIAWAVLLLWFQQSNV
ncbi:MAG: hypothetical protein Q8O51_02205 [bacterium]|nr:hypothetical protein [bacterium]